MIRIFALALVLIMTLGMMAMTASAAPITCPDHPQAVIYCTEHPDDWHYYVNNVAGGTVYTCYFRPSGTMGHFSQSMEWFQERGVTPAEGMTIIIGFEGDASICENAAPAPQPQPKTGVEDTLPIWFGVMAASACAYVLTTKKRGF